MSNLMRPITKEAERVVKKLISMIGEDGSVVINNDLAYRPLTVRAHRNNIYSFTTYDNMNNEQLKNPSFLVWKLQEPTRNQFFPFAYRHDTNNKRMETMTFKNGKLKSYVPPKQREVRNTFELFIETVKINHKL